jgi:hypothetical protein
MAVVYHQEIFLLSEKAANKKRLRSLNPLRSRSRLYSYRLSQLMLEWVIFKAINFTQPTKGNSPEKKTQCSFKPFNVNLLRVKYYWVGSNLSPLFFLSLY